MAETTKVYEIDDKHSGETIYCVSKGKIEKLEFFI